MNSFTIMISILSIGVSMVIAPPKIDIRILPRPELINHSYCIEALTVFCDKVNPEPLDCFKSAVMNWNSTQLDLNYIVNQYHKDMGGHFIIKKTFKAPMSFCWSEGRNIKPNIVPFDAIQVCRDELAEFSRDINIIDAIATALTYAVYSTNVCAYGKKINPSAVPYLKHVRDNVILDDNVETIEVYCNRIFPNASTSAAFVENI